MWEAAWIGAQRTSRSSLRTRVSFLSAAVFTVLAAAIFLEVGPYGGRCDRLGAGCHLGHLYCSGLLGLNRSFAAELADRAIDGLLRLRSIAKRFSSARRPPISCSSLGCRWWPSRRWCSFYNVDLGWTGAASIAGITLLAALGLVAVGTLFSAMAVNTRLAELLVPMITLPFLVPVVTAAAQATAIVLNGRPLAGAMGWMEMLGAFDLVFVTACTFAYPFTIER